MVNIYEYAKGRDKIMGKRAKKLLAAAFVLIALMPLVGKPLQVLADEVSATEYQVQKNDSLYKIAKTQLGSGDRWSEIFESNKDVIKDSSLIYSGQILKIPGNAEAVEQTSLVEQAEANIFAQQLYNAASVEEPLVTAQLKALESDKVHLEGLEYRLKTVESLSRKIVSDAHDMEISLSEAANNIHDGLRYTFTIDEQEYVAKTRLIMDTLIANGNSVYKFKNYWAKKDVDYQGINVMLRSKDGFIYEVQFHTPMSYYVKGEKTHKYYEIIRSETSTAEEKAEASKKQAEEYKQIPIPNGVEEISY